MGVAAFCLGFISCQKSRNDSKPPESAIQEGKKATPPDPQTAEGVTGLEGKIPKNFVKLYVELRLATTGNPNHPQRAQESRKIIMEKYKMTWKDYRNHVETLKRNPDIWEAFQESVLSELDLLEKRHKGE